MWLLYAIGSAVFAALTSILAKIGIDGVNSDLATAIRTGVVLIRLGDCVFYRRAGRPIGNKQKELGSSDLVGTCDGSLLAVLLSGDSDWEVSKVVPVDRLSVVDDTGSRVFVSA